MDLSIYIFCKNEFIFALIGPSQETRSNKKESWAGYQGSKQVESQTRPLVGRVDKYRTLIWRQMHNYTLTECLISVYIPTLPDTKPISQSPVWVTKSPG